MCHYIPNVPLWHDWSKVTYSKVHGSVVLKTNLFKRFNWISVTSSCKIESVWGTELSEQKIQCFIAERFCTSSSNLHFFISFAFYFLGWHIYLQTSAINFFNSKTLKTFVYRVTNLNAVVTQLLSNYFLMVHLFNTKRCHWFQVRDEIILGPCLRKA